jgi:Fic family protein
MFNSEEKVKKDQIKFLLEIKPMLQTTFNPQKIEKFEEFQNTDSDFANKLNELTQRIDAIEEKFDQEKEDTIRKSKWKEQIISLLEQHKKLSSSELSSLVNLSRTRCNEYFRELLKEGLTEGVIIGKKKYYKLVKK